MDKNMFFNAHHAPIGAYASFTLGFPGAAGGLDLELGQPPQKSVYVGLETREGGSFEALPFYRQADDDSRRYDVEKQTQDTDELLLRPFDCKRIQRGFRLATDTWRAGDLTFTIYSPIQSVPDPTSAPEDALKDAIVPAVFVEMTVDNTLSRITRRAFFGYEGMDPYSAMRRLDETSSLTGVGQGRLTAIATEDADVQSALHFRLEDILKAKHKENWTFGLGKVGALVFDVPPQQKKTYRFVICFYRGGIVKIGRAHV